MSSVGAGAGSVQGSIRKMSNTTGLSRKRSYRRSNSMMMNFNNSLFGQYRADLSNFRRQEVEKQQLLAAANKRRESEGDARRTKLGNGVMSLVRRCFQHEKGELVMLAVLAILMATLSFIVDRIISGFYHVRHYLTTSTDDFVYNYLIWIAYVVVMASLAALLTRWISPQAAGSGVAEMRVVVRGVVLKEYLSVKTLLAKIIGNIFVLSSGLPLGKEGPFVHITSIAATQLTRWLSVMTDNSEYESKYFEIIAVACGLGVAVTFSSPVGGVLYSIEIVTSFFSVRSYWLGFFSATVGALFLRLLMVWTTIEVNISHMFKTHFRQDYPYGTWEIFTYLLLGILCGLAAVVFIFLNQYVILLNRRKTRFNHLLQRFPLLYTILLSSLYGLISYPDFLGKYFASRLSSEEAIRELFSNYTWNQLERHNQTGAEHVLHEWKTAHTSIFAHTFIFSVVNLLLVPIFSTLPVPAGIIVLSFKIGAGIGRFYGESVTWMFPRGHHQHYSIVAGTYAMAGAAAFAGGTTGALSAAVIIFETCGQMTHMIPIIVAVLASTMVARLFTPSFYDNAIILKKLPYLPSCLPSSSNVHRIFVEDFMVTDIHYIYHRCTYRYLRHLLRSQPKFRTFPFVKSPHNMILLGSVERSELQALLDAHLDPKRMLVEHDNHIQDIPEDDEDIHEETPLNNHNQVQVPTSALDSSTWEEMQLDASVDFTNCPIETAPFQLMEGMSLMKSHSMFSLIGIRTAYVTSLGTLVGVVSLRQLRKAIEEMNSGTLPKKDKTTETVPPRAMSSEVEEGERNDDIDNRDQGKELP